MYQYPHTIENGGGEQLIFKRRIKDKDGEYLEVSNVVQPNSGPPMHVHHKQDEALTVKQGKIGTQILGEEPQFYGVGETVVFKAGVAHKFWNAGTEPLICEGWVRPPHNIEYFLTEIYKTTKENGGERPGAFEGAYLSQRYRSEFEMLEIPAFVRKVIFPVTVFLGKLAGKHKRYKDAPEPVR
ncbi:MAG TPA: cupin domain-containing protein [Patescibacteria group bacterium]|nr:cupin domain-containing protein [Patescibacteria group bacterium]